MTKKDGWWVEILKPGTWTSSKGGTYTFGISDLKSIVSNFKALYPHVKPSLILGDHPDAKGLNPAVGWVDDLKVSDNGKLLAFFVDVPEIVKGAIEKNLYRTVSSGLKGLFEYEDKQYRGVLHHVAILGAHLPAISGLESLDAYMTAGDAPEDVVSFTMSEEDEMNFEEQYKAEKALREAADTKNIELTASVETLTTERDGLVTERDELKTANDELSTKVTEHAFAADTAEVTRLVDEAVAGGRVLPKDKDKSVAVGLALKTSDVEFKDGDKNPFDQWKDQLANGGKVIEMKEKAEDGDDDDAKLSKDEKDYKAGSAAGKAVSQNR